MTRTLEEVAPRRTHPGGLSTKSTSVKIPPERSSPSSVLHCCLSDAQNLQRMHHPREGFLLLFFLKTTPPRRTATCRRVFSRRPGHLLRARLQGAPELKGRRELPTTALTAPNTRREPHHSTGILNTGDRSTSSTQKPHRSDISPSARGTPSSA